MPKDGTLVGKPAPPFTLPAIPNGEMFKLPLGEKPIALFFFPEAGSIGCKMEACSFRDAQSSNITFKRHPNLCVLGISGDDITKQTSFADDNNIKYLMVSDKDGQVRKDYGVGKAFLGTVDGRKTVFIDSKGVVRGEHTANLDLFSHVKFVEKMLKETESESKS